MCGKNQIRDMDDKRQEGSPPRVREERVGNECPSNERGITPACAGRTKPNGGNRRSKRDHPRVCGKNCCNCLLRSCCRGSPPRVREEPSVARMVTPWRRITPACAGRTGLNCGKVGYREDHPRVCGKNFPHTSKRLLKSGSPPRVREELAPVLSALISDRITPACAGRTMTGAKLNSLARDHPRVCGKNK